MVKPLRPAQPALPAQPARAVAILVEAENDPRSADHNRPPDQIRVLHHQIDRFLFRPRQRPLLEYRAPRADEIEKAIGLDVFLQELTGWGLTIDVDLVHADSRLGQKTSGVLTGRSCRLPVEGWLRHMVDFRLKIED